MIGEYKYVLDGQTPVLERDTRRWSHWFETANRQVALTEIETDLGYVRVSTIFLGIDQSFGLGSGPPELFETMIFGGWADGLTRQYSTWDEAVLGHAEMVSSVKGQQDQ